MANLIRKKIRFVGHVQGVGFRATTASIARRYFISGFVRNESDGSVSLEVQGEASVCSSFLAQVQEDLSERIDEMSISEGLVIKGQSETEGFRIRS